MAEPEIAVVYVCQGPPRCNFDGTDPESVMPCPFCKTVRADDPRTPAESWADMGAVQ